MCLYYFVRSGLKIKILLYHTIDRYDPDPSGQAAFYNGHKITVLIWVVCFRKSLSALDV